MGSAEGRIGDWRQTYSGAMYWPLDPRSGEVLIEDVAHHLATVNRFGGAASVPYSVGEHCYRVSLQVEAMGHRELALEALFHDAAEGLIGLDMIRPIKRSGLLGALLVDLENRNQREIHRAVMLPDRFEMRKVDVTEDRFIYDFPDAAFVGPVPKVSIEILEHVMPPEIAKADNVLLMTEARDLMAPPPAPWRESGNKPLGDRIIPMTFAQAKACWLHRFEELTR